MNKQLEQQLIENCKKLDGSKWDNRNELFKELEEKILDIFKDLYSGEEGFFKYGNKEEIEYFQNLKQEFYNCKNESDKELLAESLDNIIDDWYMTVYTYGIDLEYYGEHNEKIEVVRTIGSDDKNLRKPLCTCYVNV